MLGTALLMWMAVIANATVHHVPTDFALIQSALDATQSGDTVLVDRGTYHELLTGPEHTVTLMSHFAYTQDTTDIRETILDGDYAGTVLRPIANGENTTTVEGFSFVHGLGLNNGPGGGIDVGPRANLTILNCDFHHNRTEFSGAAIQCGFTDEGADRLVIEGVRIFDNDVQGSSVRMALNVWASDHVVVKNLEVFSSSSITQGRFQLQDNDSLFVSHVKFHSGDFRFISFHGNEYLSIRDVLLERCTVRGFSAFADLIVARNLEFDSLEVLGAQSSAITITAECLDLDTLRVENCWRHEHDGDIEYQLLFIGSACGDNIPVARNIHFANNLIGDLERNDGFKSTTSAAHFNHVSLENSTFLNNTMHYWDRSPEYEVSGGGALVTTAFYASEDTGRVRNCRFEGNLLVDHDDYSNVTQTPDPNTARSLSVSAATGETGTRFIEVDHLIFRNNRQPNHCPEIGAVPFGWRGVSFDFVVFHDNGNAEWTGVHDIYMEDIDDGGLYYVTYNCREADVYNIWMRNVNRSGLWTNLPCNDEEIPPRFSNFFFDHIVMQDMYYSYPYDWSHQGVMGIGGARPQNVTIVNSSGTWLLATYGMDNVLFNNNDFEMFVHPGLSVPATFEYCFADFEIPGESNLFGVDPGFDETLGAPYLSADSPCVDAGNPDPAWNDIAEDPDNPVWAAWPSQGTIRNDIGFTGGPRTAVVDTNWVGVEPHPIRQQLPQDIVLGNPYPNPFNPVTRIPFSVNWPSDIKLSVYNIRGDLVSTLANEFFWPGQHEITFDGSQLASGMYFVLLEGAAQRETKKLMLVR